MSGGIRKPGAVQNKRKTANQVTGGAAGRAADKPVARPVKNTGRAVPGRSAARPGALRAGSGSQAASGKARKMNRRYKVPLTIIFVLFLVVIVFMSSFLSYTYLVDKYANPVNAEAIDLDPDSSVKFRIDKGMSTKEIAEQLYALGLIKNKTIYRFLSKFNGYDGAYKVGTYTLSDGLSYDEIMTLLAAEPETVRVTFPEGFTTEQIAARLEANNVVTAEEFLEAVEKVDVSSYPFLSEVAGTTRDHRLDGYLFPDTYEFDVKANVQDVVYKMLNRFNELYLPVYYEESERIGLTTDQVIILASIVEREAKLQSERPVIAGVFMNRLGSDDPSLRKLQSCATIRYIYKKLYNEDVINILEEHERVEDPYNTYLHDGLTPGPICNPGIQSIKAVLNYDVNDYYFFVLNAKDGVGSHIFSKTYQEHLQAKNQYG
ncbi:MAG: endolytic transglycosylase MltG [Clostridia bacterium]